MKTRTRMTVQRLSEREALVVDVLDRYDYPSEDQRDVIKHLRTVGASVQCSFVEDEHFEVVRRIMELDAAKLDHPTESGDSNRLELIAEVLRGTNDGGVRHPVSADDIGDVLDHLRERGSLDECYQLELYDYQLINRILNLAYESLDLPASIHRWANSMFAEDFGSRTTSDDSQSDS